MHGLPPLPPRDMISWCDKYFRKIVRQTDLCRPLVRNNKPEYDENGTPKIQWFRFHDLRKTAVTRYRNKPYRMDAKYYEYLLGEPNHRYAQTDLEDWCDDIREIIEKGDEKISCNGEAVLLTPDIVARTKAWFGEKVWPNTDVWGDNPTPEQYREWKANLANDN
jgi:hypothetical protein